MREEKTAPRKITEIEEVFRTLKNRILFYPNLYIPDFIIYDLAKSIEEFYEEDSN
ncbi:MAG: hypothetical protein ABH954_02965 [Candidatus Omnitrophota bacterium]